MNPAITISTNGPQGRANDPGAAGRPWLSTRNIAVKAAF